MSLTEEIQNNDAIPNWSVHYSRRVMVSAHQVQLDDEIIYGTNLAFILEFDDTGCPVQAIRIVTDIYERDIIEAIKLTASSLSWLFETINDAVMVIDLDGNELEPLSLETIMNNPSKIRVKK